MKYKKFAFALLFIFFIFTTPNITLAFGLTRAQIQTIISLLEAFGVDSETISTVRASLEGKTTSYNPVSNSEAKCALKYGPNFSKVAQQFASRIDTEEACVISCNTYGKTVANNLNTTVACVWNGSTVRIYSPQSQSCVDLTKNMGLGSTDRSTGGEVSKLQRFLAGTGDYTYGEITGYYGFATMRAVQKYQCRKLGICSGSIYTNGYGAVGPKTRKSLSCVKSTQSTQQTIASTQNSAAVRCNDMFTQYPSKDGKSFASVNIIKNQKVNSPLFIRLRVGYGNWTVFEGHAGMVQLYVEDNKIAEAVLKSSNRVFATAVLNFDSSLYDGKEARLVIKNENPSGLPDKNIEVEIPVVISKDARVCEFKTSDQNNSYYPKPVSNTIISFRFVPETYTAGFGAETHTRIGYRLYIKTKNGAEVKVGGPLVVNNVAYVHISPNRKFIAYEVKPAIGEVSHVAYIADTTGVPHKVVLENGKEIGFTHIPGSPYNGYIYWTRDGKLVLKKGKTTYVSIDVNKPWILREEKITSSSNYYKSILDSLTVYEIRDLNVYLKAPLNGYSNAQIDYFKKNIVINWGDGTKTQFDSNNKTEEGYIAEGWIIAKHTYNQPGTYTISAYLANDKSQYKKRISLALRDINSTASSDNPSPFLSVPEVAPMASDVLLATNVVINSTGNRKLFIDFGDGAKKEIMAEGATCRNYCKYSAHNNYYVITNGRIQIKHVFKNPGTYTVRIIDQNDELIDPRLEARIRVYGVK